MKSQARNKSTKGKSHCLKVMLDLKVIYTDSGHYVKLVANPFKIPGKNKGYGAGCAGFCAAGAGRRAARTASSALCTVMS
jgi:hypothetical protein